MKCTITIKDEVWCVVGGLIPQHVDALWHKFGIFVDGYFFMPAFKLRRWDGKIRFFEKTGRTYVRLIELFLPIIIDDWNYEVELVDNRKPFSSPLPQPFGKITKVDEQGIALEAEGLDVFGDIELPTGQKLELRPYQLQAMNIAVEAGSGFLILGTGAGKTLITAGISRAYEHCRVMTIVPSADLVDQTYETYLACGLDTGRYDGDHKEIYHRCIVSTWQSLQNNPALLEDFQCVIWDESHGAKASVAQKILNDHGAHIPFKFGVTGTMPLPDCDVMTLKSSIGDVLFEVPAKWLMDHGYLAKAEIQPVELNESYVDEDFPSYDSEKAFVSKSDARLERIADLVISVAAVNGNTLVLTNSIAFGKRLSALIKDSVFLYGDSSKDLRREHYDMFASRDDLIVIASSGIASTGISIDRIFCLVMIDAGKSFTKAIQSIGRGLRLGHDKDFVQVYDVYSKLKWSKKHAKERDKYYKKAGYTVAKKQTLKV